MNTHSPNLEARLEKLKHKLEYDDLSVKERYMLSKEIENLEAQIRFNDKYKGTKVPNKWRLKL